jgi:sec-independent protein translocase protein TatC
MTIWEHIGELRTRLIRVMLAVVLGALAGWFLYPYVLNFLQNPFCQVRTECQFIATEPLQAFGLRIKMSAYIGIAVAMPVILWQVWKFVTPGLYTHEKRYAIPFMVSALTLFAMGAAVAYVTLNPTLEFLTSIGGGDITPFYTAESYVTLIVWMMLAFGVGFEFPVVLVALMLMNVITPRRLLQWWRLAIVVIAIIAAVITPSGDPISMIALSVPMLVLYFLSAGLGAVLLALRRRSQRRSAASQS